MPKAKRKKMRIVKRWEIWESDLIRDFIKEHPEVETRHYVLKSLKGCFDNRPRGSIYSKWHKMRKAMGFNNYPPQSRKAHNSEPPTKERQIELPLTKPDLPILEVVKEFNVMSIFTNEFQEALYDETAEKVQFNFKSREHEQVVVLAAQVKEFRDHWHESQLQCESIRKTCKQLEGAIDERNKAYESLLKSCQGLEAKILEKDALIESADAKLARNRAAIGRLLQE